MSKYWIVIVIVASCVFGGNAFSADWKYYGEFSTVPGIEEALFYDSSSIIITSNSIKLWVKTVLYNDIEKCLEDKLIVEKAATKIASGYNAPITKIYPKIANVAYLEEAANESTIKTKAEILYQILCDEKKIRKITGESFHKDGSRSQGFGITKWEDIAPESNADNLAKILCRSK